MQNSIFKYIWLLIVINLHAQDQLTINGNLMIHGTASVTIFGNLINNGAFVDSSQWLTLGGSTPQQIGGTSLTTFKNLTLNNSTGSFLSSNAAITRELKISSGTFSTTGFNFTLISDQNGTGRIAPIIGNFSGNITMQRYLPTGSTGWRFMASPVSGTTINDWQDNFTTSGFPGATYPGFAFTSIYTYDESVPGILDNGYIGASAATETLIPGKGYWCYIGPVPLTIDVTGPPAKFTQSFPVTYNASTSPADDGWVMIGNPYPSPIDWVSSSWTKTNINSAIYIWNPNLQQYASWVSGTGINGGSNIIPSSQSFWIQTNTINPVLSCNENVKSTIDQPFMRPASPSTFNNLRLVIEGNGFNDEAILRFGSSATNGYDTDADARKVYSWNPQVPGICSLDTTMTDLSINSLPLVQKEIHIPVKTIVGVSGIYTVGINNEDFIHGNQCVILEDLLTGIKLNLMVAPTFTFFISDTTKVPRFLIHITASPIIKTVSAICHKSNNGMAIVAVMGQSTWKYTWKDSLNQVIQVNQGNYLSDTLRQLTAGFYSVSVTDQSGLCGIISSGFKISSPSPLTASFMLSKDTLDFGIDSLYLSNTSIGALNFIWDFGDHSGIQTSAFSHFYSQEGEYKVKLVAQNNICKDSTIRNVKVLSQNPLGFSEITEHSNFHVFPNPGEGLFHFRMPESIWNKSNIFIFDNLGREILSEDLHSGSIEIDLKGHRKGIYFYRIKCQGREDISGKLIIQ